MTVSVTTSAVLAFSLVLCRMAGFFMLAPVFSSGLVPTKWKASVILMFSLFTVMILPAKEVASLPTDSMAIAVLAVKEITIGFALGFTVSMLFAGLQAAGGLLDIQSGFAMSTLLDPVTNTQTSMLSQFYYLIGVISFLVMDGAAVMLGGLVQSFRLVPLEAFPHLHAMAAQAVSSFVQLFTITMEIAAPVFVATFVTDFALGLVVRAMPQANIYVVGLPVKISVALIAVGSTIPAFLYFFNDRMNEVITQMSNLALSLIH